MKRDYIVLLIILLILVVFTCILFYLNIRADEINNKLDIIINNYI